MTVIVNEVGLMHDSELTQLKDDPNWQPMQLVTIKGFSKQFAVIGKSSDRRVVEYLVCPLYLLGLVINADGLNKFREVNPNIKI